MDKDKEIAEYQQKIREFTKEKNSETTIHKFSKGNYYFIIIKIS